MANETVLVVDDDAALRGLVAAQLRREGFRPLEAASGEEALAALGLPAAARSEEAPASRLEGCALVILDIMLGGVDGFEVLKAIRRQRPELPVMLLSARGEDHDKVLGFGLGADDYVTKPFSPAELMARAKARLGRPGRAAEPPREVEAGPFSLDLAGCVLYKEGRALELSARELALMRLFLENPGRVFTKAQIYARIWDGDYCEDNTVMVHVSRLRDKIEEDSGAPEHILTVRGLGYKFAPGLRRGGDSASPEGRLR
jgi:DNA-binding response OmpR family regulator